MKTLSALQQAVQSITKDRSDNESEQAKAVDDLAELEAAMRDYRTATTDKERAAAFKAALALAKSE